MPYYEVWQRDVIPAGGPIIGPALALVDICVDVVSGTWPPALDQDAPLIVVANHPYGILDGLGTLSLVEQLGRPYKVLIHKDLMKVPEIQPFSLPIDFEPTRAAQATNLATRKEALRLLAEGTTIVVFPGGGVSTAPINAAAAVDLPWKPFTARMIQSSGAQVLPLYYEGQCSRLFQWVSRFSPTLRTSLLIREFRSQVGKSLKVHVGDVIPYTDMAQVKDRKAMIEMLCAKVHALGGIDMSDLRANQTALPEWLRG